MVTMMVYTDFFSYNGGIYSYVSGILEGGHSVLLIGYNDAAQYFVAKNSWGTNWGEGGFFRIAYNQVSGFSQVKFGDYAALVTVNPSLCLTTVSAAGESGIVEQNLSAAGTTGTLYITTSSNSCAWTVVSNVPWIEISSQSSGTGSALVSFTVAPNPNADSRNGTITIANYRLTVNQKGTAPEPYVLAAKLPLNGDVAPGVAVDRLGNVYVAEMLYNKIVKFDPQGSFVTNWGSCGTGDGQFTNPYGIAIDPSGYVYVADLSFNRIQKFDSQGNFVKVMGAHSTRSVAVDGSGYIYYSDMCLDNIVKLDPSGLLVAKWGSRGSGDGQFNGPREVAVDPSGYVYVYDSSNFRIQKFDTEGRFLSKWGSYGLADGQFMGLENSLGIDNLGSVYVVDSVKYNIQKFDNHGNLIAKWSSRGSADGQISWWGGVAVDPSGFVYVGDAGRIQKFVKYVPGCYTLSKSANPEVGGSVTVNTAINCAGGYTSGTAISLTATPATNYVFSSWTGSGGTFSNSSAASTTFAISGNASVTANFTYVPPCYTLSKSANPSGGGSVTVNTASNCTGGYTSGTAISLTATPATNYVFSSWTGSGGTFSNSSSAYTTFTISGNASVTANFTLGPPGAAVLLWPSGSIPTPTPAFSWNAVPGSTWYYLRVNDANTSPKILRWYTSQEAGCPSDTGTCSVSSLAVLAQGAAQWWIETWNDYGYGPWSSGMAFTVSGNLPGATTLISPSGTVSTNSPAYVWNAVPNASWYYLWVTDAGASPKIVQWYTAEQAGCVSGMVTCSVSSPAVSAQGAAQWWIQTWNDAGYGPWSQGMTFSVSGSLPGMSTLVSPSGKISTKSPTYTWNLVPNATYYYLWVNDSTGTKVATWYTAAQAGCASGTGTCSATPSVTLASGAAQWWIQTWNPSGYGPWSTAIALIVP
jgi:sugar lactone lactonase YvrE